MLYLSHRTHPSGKTDNHVITDDAKVIVELIKALPDFAHKEEVLKQVQEGRATVEIHTRGY